MTATARYSLCALLVAIGVAMQAWAWHPLRLSLCEIEYKPDTKMLSVNLKLFLTDVNEALVFDPNSDELSFCQPNESPDAVPLLVKYLGQFFYVKANGVQMPLAIKRKKLSGTGDNTALWVYFEVPQPTPLKNLEVKNAVFTDLFFDQTNLVYAHIDGESKSLMLNKKTPSHKLVF